MSKRDLENGKNAKWVDQLFQEAFAEPGYELTVDLAAQQIIKPNGSEIPFEVDAFRRHCLLEGLDDIGLTLQHADDIRAFEAKRRTQMPWLFLSR